MRRRFRIAVCVALLALVGLAVWRSTPPNEPVYEGKTLSKWLERHVASSAADPPYNSPGWQKAHEALRHIGTNGIPTLLRMISAKDPPPAALKVRAYAHKWGLIKSDYRHAYQRNEEAQFAFETLGTNAASAVPELIKIYEADVSRSSQRCAALSLGHIGPAARPAVPALLKNFSHTNSDVRFYAVSAIYHIGGEPRVLVPPLTRALKDPKPEIRWNASGALMGLRAREAVPEILAAIDDLVSQNYEGLTQQLQYVVWHIAPEKVGRPLMVESATPSVTNGVTAQRVDALYEGTRRTLIKPGRKVPCLTQFWDSNPQHPLALYRCGSEPGETNRFLGEFQVVGIPLSESVNVSWLCIIADEQIVLSARDNNSKAFLETRRVK